QVRVNDLDRCTFIRCECGSKNGVACHDAVQCALERGYVQSSVHPECPRDRISQVSGMQLIEHPKQFLRIGERCGCAIRLLGYGGRLSALLQAQLEEPALCGR